MKQTLFSFLFLFASALYFSQSQLKVISNAHKTPIPDASVYCDDNLIGKTNKDGYLSFKTQCKKVDILANDFEDEEAVVKKEMEVVLKPTSEKTRSIRKITLADKSDPRALKMLDELLKKYKENSPQSLDSYKFKSYSKTSIDFDKDSVDVFQNFMTKRNDSIGKIQSSNLKTPEKKKKDSLAEEDLVNIVQNSQYFLWEKASEYYFSKKYGEKTNILDNRMSGFPNPVYEALTINLSNLNKIPRQIKTENRERYRYYLSDTINLDNRKTYVIKFKEANNKLKQNPRKYSGFIYIDAENYALKKIESNSKKINEGNIVSVWKPINNKWFMDYENLRVRMGDQSFNIGKVQDSTAQDGKPKMKKKRFGNYLYIKNQFFGFEINKEQKAGDYRGYTMTVKNTDGKLLQEYRTDSLTGREKNTYVKIDSLVKKYDFDKKVSLFTNLMKGKLRYKMLDFDLTKIFSYDKYQGVRLGASVKLNENFSKTFSPDAYFGYGFKDHHWKYGAGLDVKLSDKRTSVFRIDYADDVYAAGRINTALWDNPMKLKDIIVDLYNANFYRSKKWGASFLYDLSNTLTAKVSINHENQNALFYYQYQNLGNSFKNVSTTLSLKYAPNDKNLMTPGGKLTYEKHFPQFYLNYENGSKIFDGELNYHRLDAMAVHQFKTKLGYTNMKVFGGFSSGTAPIWKNFEITGQADVYGTNWASKISKPSNLGFVTMPSGTFYADKFIGLKLTQYLPFKFRTIGKAYSNIELEYNAVAGNFKNSADHQFNFQVLDHYYQEVGFIWNKFLGTKFGVGFSYRLGYYQQPGFKDNIGFQIRLNAF
ncbi:hypothetical protein ATB99_14000 [Elizabethkingia meningoseptica]|uniref:DUF5686 family protein n=1 Tax=Elizabethkingia meningoseptica TaxID=238 RepID=UPI000332D476|nr:DUF5686 family protein [Elizabethkingia meningoseptica]AQX06556.1 hypothetical protein BBD33_15395 [Elizabethkingia meningoseptica]AQX48602.1 hypothetical protein B5G46_15390 [Elizabethkingia meningoseptica]EOR29409.1 hypothetical protein L100_11538 [Elizabethkingia meningoseptica ATCC 13253 = NBRC 12535]KUY13656.1 hypothetical protein ATB99_14000 [Elizabethkingia meningoseptica]OPB75553.1 hypothetical protein BAY30_00350 [Elizabethkingia meningoseptica]